MTVLDLLDATVTRLKADTAVTVGLNTVTSGRIYTRRGAIGDMSLPYVVVFGSDIANDTMNSDDYKATITVVYVNRAGTDLAVFQNAAKRIHGDGILQADRRPLYGLNRWLVGSLTADTVYSSVGGDMLRVSEDFIVDDENFTALEMVFECNVTKSI